MAMGAALALALFDTTLAQQNLEDKAAPKAAVKLLAENDKVRAFEITFAPKQEMGDILHFSCVASMDRGRWPYATHSPSFGRRLLLSRHQSRQRADRGVP
jgi:hypothetical protein